jgi:hypothetical protein
MMKRLLNIDMLEEAAPAEKPATNRVTEPVG